jgi:hypothetical protein
MTDYTPVTSLPESYTPRETSDILDRVKMLVAPKLPGCTPRRFDYPIFDGWSHIELCFSDPGPIVPKLIISPDGYYCISSASFAYSSMLRGKMNVGAEFLRSLMGGAERLDAGPEAIARKVLEAVEAFDLTGAIAAGTVERIWADQPRSQIPPHLLELALCGIYLRAYRDAGALLRDCGRFAAQYGWPGFTAAGQKADAYLAKLSADPEALRDELVTTMEGHWSHFKVVDGAS